MARFKSTKAGRKKKEHINRANVVIRRTPAETMQAAVTAVLGPQGMSIRAAAKNFDIPYCTLHSYVAKRRASGTDEIRYNANYSVRMVFSKDQEQQLYEYLLKAAKHNYGLTRKCARSLAYDFAALNNDIWPTSWDASQMAGKEWYIRFMRRHPDLSLRKPEATSLARCSSFNRHNVMEFFGNLDAVYKEHKFSANDVYNCDETGVTTVQKTTNVRIIAARSDRQVARVTSAERGQLVTVCCTINAVGNTVPPFMVFPRVHFKPSMLKGAPSGTDGAATASGWMTAKTFMKYLEHFVKHVKCSPDQKVLLLLDNHDSHISLESLDFCKRSGVVLLTFPPHCSHRLQPLDVAVYGPFKQFYSQSANAWMNNNPGRPMVIHDVAEVVGMAYPLAFTPKNITAAFRSTGIFPYNPNIFTDEDFMSSYVTDRPLVATQAKPIDGAGGSGAQGDGAGGSGAQGDGAGGGGAQGDEAGVSGGHGDEAGEGGAQGDGAGGGGGQRKGKSLSQSVSPEQIRPFPKAPPRKGASNRRLAKSRILTKTPVKAELEAELLARDEKKKSKLPKKKKEVLVQPVLSKKSTVDATPSADSVKRKIDKQKPRPKFSTKDKRFKLDEVMKKLF